MIGLALRITALMTATLLLVVLILVGAWYLQRDEDPGGLRASLPERVAAVVELLEATPPSDAGRVLRAVSAPDFRVALREGPLDAASQDSEFPLVARLVRRAVGALGERRVAVRVSGGPRTQSRLAALLGRDGLGGGRPMRIAVELRDGRVVEIEVRGAALQRALRRPFIGAVLLLLAAIGLAALWALRSQIRPLEALAREVERVGTAAEGAPLPEGGARELRQLVTAFNRMRERIHLLIEGRTRMLAAISHDLGTYLTRLRLRIELIADPEQRARAEKDLADMQQLLSDALALARADGGAEARRERVDLVAIAARETRERRDAGAEVALQAPETLEVLGHALPLARVFSNLVGNAIKYGGCAEITLRRAGGEAEVQVDDRGPGIPAAEREAVLEPFYRRDQARNLDEGGSGLGLAIVADIVRRHGGELRLEERPGGGLRVRLRLPALPEAGKSAAQ